MPIVHIDLIAGRTTEKKKAMIKRVCEVIHETIECPMEAIKIVVNDVDPSMLAPGNGITWDDIPDEDKKYKL